MDGLAWRVLPSENRRRHGAGRNDSTVSAGNVRLGHLGCLSACEKAPENQGYDGAVRRRVTRVGSWESVAQGEAAWLPLVVAAIIRKYERCVLLMSCVVEARDSQQKEIVCLAMTDSFATE